MRTKKISIISTAGVFLAVIVAVTALFIMLGWSEILSILDSIQRHIPECIPGEIAVLVMLIAIWYIVISWILEGWRSIFETFKEGKE